MTEASEQRKVPFSNATLFFFGLKSACSTSYSPSMFDVISPLSTVESDLSSSGNLTNSWSSSITECLKQRTSSQFYDEPFRGTETSNYMSTINSTTCPTSGLKRKERTTSEEKVSDLLDSALI